MAKPTAEYYCYVRSMIMAEFPCPPLPVAGHRLEDDSRAVLNSHDMISTLMITAMQMQDDAFNARRRRRQEELELEYHQRLERAKSFEETYAAMTCFTQHYIQSYLLHDNNHFMDVRVLPIDYATPGLRRQIRSFANAAAIIAGEEDVTSAAPVTQEELSDARIRETITKCVQRIINTP